MDQSQPVRQSIETNDLVILTRRRFEIWPLYMYHQPL